MCACVCKIYGTGFTWIVVNNGGRTQPPPSLESWGRWESPQIQATSSPHGERERKTRQEGCRDAGIGLHSSCCVGHTGVDTCLFSTPSKVGPAIFCLVKPVAMVFGKAITFLIESVQQVNDDYCILSSSLLLSLFWLFSYLSIDWSISPSLKCLISCVVFM